MVSKKDYLLSLANRYLECLGGSDIRAALEIHAANAEVNLKYLGNISEMPAITLAWKVFEMAHGQRKLDAFQEAIASDFPGFLENLVDRESSIPTDIEAEIPQAHLAEAMDESVYRDWLRSEVEYVDIRGIGERPADQAVVFPILDLYTELYVQTGLTNLDLERGRIRGQRRISLTEMVQSTRCLVIMGDPGSGKTTFLRFLARKNVEDLSKPLPMYLRLIDVHEFALEKQLPLDPNILLNFYEELSGKENLQLRKTALERKAVDGELLWLLDSLDELPSAEVRETFVSMLEKAARRWKKCCFILTSRPLPVKAKAIPIDFVRVGIDHWTESDIKAFVQAWTRLLYPNSSEERLRRHWGTLLATIMERAELRSLARNAVMVTAMAVVHYNDTRLPEGRADLLEALIYWLIRARSHSKSHLGQSSLDVLKFVERMYQELALAMLEAEGGRRRRVGLMWAASELSKNFSDDVDAALDFLVQEELETGVLVRRGEGDIEFWHLSFLEYLAAK